VAVVDEIADLLAPSPLVVAPETWLDVPEIAYGCPPLPSYDNLQWLGEPQYVLYGLPVVDVPPLAWHVVPIPDTPLSTPGSADVTAVGPGAVDMTAATMSANISVLGPGAAVVTLLSDER
jgi:hypothetical protein